MIAFWQQTPAADRSLSLMSYSLMTAIQYLTFAEVFWFPFTVIPSNSLYHIYLQYSRSSCDRLCVLLVLVLLEDSISQEADLRQLSFYQKGKPFLTRQTGHASSISHVQQCNYECGFCFHTAKTSYVLPIDEAKRGIKLLVEAGMRKINFAGGEPFLYPAFLGELVR